jgi:hypothetical protein
MTSEVIWAVESLHSILLRMQRHLSTVSNLRTVGEKITKGTSGLITLVHGSMGGMQQRRFVLHLVNLFWCSGWVFSKSLEEVDKSVLVLYKNGVYRGNRCCGCMDVCPPLPFSLCKSLIVMLLEQ